MGRTILFEGQNLTLPRGTGIASYARTLASVVRDLGYTTEVLVPGQISRPAAHGAHGLRDVDGLLQDTRSALQRRVSKTAREIAGAPFGVRPVPLRVGPGGEKAGGGPLSGFATIHASPEVVDVARAQFKRWGKPLAVKLDEPPAVFHATQATPMRVAGCPNVYTIHDIVPLRAPHTTLDDKRFFRDMVRYLCHKADHIVTVSEFSRADIMDFAGISGDRITNTYQAVELPAEFLAESDDQVAEVLSRAYGLDFKEYFIFVGAIEPKKNLSRLIDAYAASGSKRPLVIVGGLGWQYGDILEKLNDERFMRLVTEGNSMYIRRQVRRLGYVSARQLARLTRGARALFFPSIYEGFGLPVVEAMQLGTPVLTSNSTSLAEISGDAALLVDPFDVDDIARGIWQLDGDDTLRADLERRGARRAESFSRENYARRLDALYARLV